MDRSSPSAPRSVPRQPRRRLRSTLRILDTAAAALSGALCSELAAGQGAVTTLAPQLFGPKNVLEKFSDPSCNSRIDGQGTTQSWTRVDGATGCYEVTQGLLCTYRCIFKLECQYDSGSGVVARFMDDLSCSEPASSVKPFAPDWYWSQAERLFTGACVPDGFGVYYSFAQALDSNHFPDCASFGEVEPGVEGGAQTFDETYTLQFYQDLECLEEYEVSTFGDRPTSRFEFKLYRGAQHCYDMIDVTPRGNTSARDIGFDIKNFRILCGNIDGVGNGFVIETYDEPKCTGRASAAVSWSEAFYPMNYPAMTGLLKEEKCTVWGLQRAKFDKPFAAEHVPDCEDWACTQDACSGGRVKSADDTSGTIYRGNIASSGGDPSDPASLGLKAPVSAAFSTAGACAGGVVILAAISSLASLP